MIKVKELWQWYITVTITGFLDFDRHLVFLNEHIVSETGSVSVLR
jgi:hypothetical protein